MAKGERVFHLNLFTSTLYIYMLLLIAITCLYSVFTQDLVLIEAGFKVAVALISLNIAVRRSMPTTSDIATAISVSLVIMAFYTMNLDNPYIVAIAYVTLCILISLVYRPRNGGSIKWIYFVEKYALYLVPSIFLWGILRDELMSLSIIAIAIALTMAIEMIGGRTYVGIAKGYSISCPTKFKNLITSVTSAGKNLGDKIVKIEPLQKLILYSNILLTKTKSIGMRLSGIYITTTAMFTVVEEYATVCMYSIANAIIVATKKAIKVEKYVEIAFYRVSKVVEELQQKMEHSFILLLFLMGVLLLIAITFYIIFVI